MSALLGLSRKRTRADRGPRYEEEPAKTGGGAGGGWLRPENAVSDKTCLIDPS